MKVQELRYHADIDDQSTAIIYSAVVLTTIFNSAWMDAGFGLVGAG